MKKFLVILTLVIALAWGTWFVFTEYLYVVPILTYHRIDAIIHSDSPTVLGENFDQQMEFIHSRGYKVISLDELVDALKENRKLPHNSVAITIDDGYKEIYLYGYPVLKKYNFPATIFIISGKIGQEGYLSWDEMREMSKNNISFGGHTRNHVYLPETKEEQLKDEILGSKKDIEANLNQEVKYFCYPLGGFNDKIIKMVKEASYLAAFTTNRGRGRLNKNIYALKRVKPGNADIIPFRMWGKLSGFFNLFRSEKEPY